MRYMLLNRNGNIIYNLIHIWLITLNKLSPLQVFSLAKVQCILFLNFTSRKTILKPYQQLEVHFNNHPLIPMNNSFGYVFWPHDVFTICFTTYYWFLGSRKDVYHKLRSRYNRWFKTHCAPQDRLEAGGTTQFSRIWLCNLASWCIYQLLYDVLCAPMGSGWSISWCPFAL